MEREMIIKALECCINNTCNECPRLGKLPCQEPLMKDAISLINELTKEAENYKSVAEYQQSSNMSRGFELREKDRENNRLIREIDRLTEENERLKSVEFTCAFIKPHKVLECPIFDEIERTKADTVKKMQERLKEKIHESVYQYWNKGDGGYYLAEDVDDDIDQIAKEMLEGTDERE